MSVINAAQASTVIDLSHWKSGDSTIDKFQFIEDHTYKLAIDSIAESSDWISPESGVTNRGFSDYPSWITFDLNNPTDTDKKIVVEYVDASAETIDLYYRLKGSREDFNHEHFSYNAASEGRSVSFYRPAFSITVPANSNIEVFYRLFQGNVFPMHRFDTMRIWEEKAFYRTGNIELSLLMILLCTELSMGLATLIAYFSTRDRLFLYYTAFAFSAASLFASLSGIWGYFVMTEHYQLCMVVLQINICQITAILFVRKFLNIAEHLPKVNTFLLLVVAIDVIGVLLNLFGKPYLSRIIIDYTAIGYFILIPLGLYAHKKRVPHALLFSCSWLIFIVGMVLASLRYRGYIANTPLSEWLIYFGGFVEIFLLTTVLVLRFRHMQHEKLVIEREHRQHLVNAARVLEEKVNEQTQQLRIAKTRAEREARTDPLTGLPNRRSFFENAQAFLLRSRRKNDPSVYLLMIDIDHFKRINDTYGHAAGDAILHDVAKILKGVVRCTDLISRLGGEEFAIVMEGVTDSEAQKLTERLHFAIENNEFTHNQQVMSVTISIGSASWDQNLTLDQLMRKADNALYDAKSQGRNQIVYANPIALA
ncbi:sensor domain-containing diguanylate cyclase [Veronia nyctiphanis]|nr:diguanylate cyclase [Veronia nyctiphanis]